jgi:hypothetical protein
MAFWKENAENKDSTKAPTTRREFGLAEIVLLATGIGHNMT